MICAEYQGCDSQGEAFEWDSRDAMLIELMEKGEPIVIAPCGHKALQVNLRYLATMTPEEQVALAEEAVVCLADGWWGGVETNQGGHDDCFYDNHDAAAHQAPIKRFVEDCLRGEWKLNEGFVAGYCNDLAGSLRLMRGWCPHAPYDKHDATEWDQYPTENVEAFLKTVEWTWL